MQLNFSYTVLINWLETGHLLQLLPQSFISAGAQKTPKTFFLFNGERVRYILHSGTALLFGDKTVTHIVSDIFFFMNAKHFFS